MTTPFVRLSPVHLLCCLALASPVSAQTATQLRLSNPSTGQGTPLVIDTTGRSVGVHDLTRSTTRPLDGAVASVDNQTTWDLNPAGGYLAMTSTTTYSGWQGSGVSLDTRYGAGFFDSFTVGTGNSGLANGTEVQLNLALTIQVAAQTDAFKFQTGSNWLGFTVQQSNPISPASALELFSFDYDVTVYEFFRQAVIGGITQFSLSTEYVNGQGDEADVFQFVIPLTAVVGETLELGLLAGDLVPSSYTYDIGNFAEGTRQDLGNGQENFGNHFEFNVAWDLEHAAGFAGLDVVSTSGFVPSAMAASAVPEPSATAAMLGLAALGAGWARRLLRPAPASTLT